jgi:hypothetical protein
MIPMIMMMIDDDDNDDADDDDICILTFENEALLRFSIVPCRCGAD